MPHEHTAHCKRSNSSMNAVESNSRDPFSIGIMGKWRMALRIAAVLCVIFVTFSLAYGLTVYFYNWMEQQPRPYFVQMTTVGFAILLLIVASLILGRLGRHKRRVFWQAIIEAIRRMTKGDFNVQIDVSEVSPDDDHPFQLLVHSINDMAQELAHLEQMRQEFIANVSHEIQSPLTSILGFIGALKNDALSHEERRHYLDVIETESKRMSRLSDNLLKLTSLESGYHPFHTESFRLDRQIRDVVLSLEPLWRRKELRMDLSLENVSVIGDKDLLSQVWINLLNNAIKFTESQQSISISVDVNDKWINVSFEDTGIGMKEDDQTHIFERFYKVDKARQRGESGSGLGLTIVKKIVDMHEGEVVAASQYGVGTTMIVRLPNKSI